MNILTANKVKYYCTVVIMAEATRSRQRWKSFARRKAAVMADEIKQTDSPQDWQLMQRTPVPNRGELLLAQTSGLQCQKLEQRTLTVTCHVSAAKPLYIP